MFNKTTKQAIRALIELAKLPSGQWEGAREIATRIKAPQNYLGKLLQHLSSAKVVVSKKGLKGGFCLGKKPEKITLYEVALYLNHIDEWTQCVVASKKCSNTAVCTVHEQWKDICQNQIDFLKKTTIADLISNERK